MRVIGTERRINYNRGAIAKWDYVTLPTNASARVISFTSIDIDEIGALNLAFPTRITIPEGIRLVRFVIYLRAPTSVLWFLRKNGADVAIVDDVFMMNLYQGYASGLPIILPMFKVNTGDYFEFRSGQAQGSGIVQMVAFEMEVIR